MKRQFDRVRNHNSIFSSWKTILERTFLFRNKNAQCLLNVVSIHIFVYLQHNIFIYCMRANPLQSCPTLCDPWTVACQASLSMGFFRQEYWSGLPCPTPGDLPDPGIEPVSLMFPRLAVKFFTTSATWRRRQWHPTPVFSPGKSHGWRSLVGYSPQGHKESDPTERLHFSPMG